MLTIGTKLGPYEIQSALGAGGMGEVYRARDTKLNRDVALKILPDVFLHDPERVGRFRREAQILAALNHPHIAAIYSLEESSGVSALVMELVEGHTLAQILEQVAASTPPSKGEAAQAAGVGPRRKPEEADGGLPLQQALDYARQIIDAFEAAHEKGIIHRDLKPANIAITPDGQVKVLDFGLAKALEGDASTDLSNSPTLSLAATRAGVIIGTAAYMSPEQAKGRAADKRTDIWAFGCVLYEMLTGKRAFDGEDVTDTIAAVVRGEPDWNALPPDVPPQIVMLIKRCLVKDRKHRIPDIGVARFLMTETIAATPAPAVAAPESARAPRQRVFAATGVGLAAGILLTAAAGWAVMRLMPERPPQPVRFAIVPPPAQPLSIFGLDRDIAISPDGTHIVYRAGTGPGQLVVRAIDRLDAQPLAGITNAHAPFLSPDGRWIGFYELPELKKVSITGGPPITLCRVAGGARGASWGPDDTIIFATNDLTSGLLSVPAGGGEPKVLTKPDTAKGEADHLFPSILPGGRAVLFTMTAPGQVENAQVAVLDLKTGERRILIRGGSHAEYVETGHLVYAAAGTLRAVRFDLERLEVVSDPVPVVEQVMTSGTGAANFAISRGGTLVFVPGGAGTAASALRSLVWVNRQGKEEPIKIPARAYIVPRLSPDGTRVALEVRDQENDVWILDLRRDNLTRLTFHPNLDQLPIWTPDGRRVIFASSGAGAPNLFWQAADGTGAAERLTTSQNPHLSHAISPDGSRLVLQELSPQTGSDLMLLMLDAGTGPSTGLGALRLSSGQAGPSTAARRAEPLIQTTFAEMNPEISPDGRWLAYQSLESAQFQVYVRPFPKVDGGRWQVSTAGGTRPAWARNGRELFYLDGSNALTAVPIQSTAATFSAGNPSKVLDPRYFTISPYRSYDVSPDGQRFLMIKDTTSAEQTSTSTPASMVVVLNWFEELKARAK